VVFAPIGGTTGEYLAIASKFDGQRRRIARWSQRVRIEMEIQKEALNLRALFASTRRTLV
jgi:hypothetical protein